MTPMLFYMLECQSKRHRKEIKYQRSLKQTLPSHSAYKNNYYFKNKNTVKPSTSSNKKRKKFQ